MINSIVIKSIKYKYIFIKNPLIKKKKLKNYFYKKNYLTRLLIIILSILFLLTLHKNYKVKLKLNNNILKSNEKKIFFKTISKNENSSYNILYLMGKMRFGNFIISLNNAIIICEIIDCKHIIIKKSNRLYIKNKIILNKLNISIEPNSNYNNFILQKNNILSFNARFFYYYHFKYIKKTNKIYLLKNEIIKNLPKVQTLPNSLYIHIRSGDIFKGRGRKYAQPPFCFYKKIINEFNFKNIFIISQNELNPVINKLLKIYPYIKYKKNELRIDISYLANSYNIVSSKSSFLVSIIKLNEKLKYLWEYDFYRLSERYFHLHYSVYNFTFNYTIYRMNASRLYREMMYSWRCSKNQIYLLLNDKCINKFDIIPPRN